MRRTIAGVLRAIADRIDPPPVEVEIVIDLDVYRARVAEELRQAIVAMAERC